ncbi:conserved exported protein of unknown function [Tenacibaculum sp. 190130A14a]|uniref:Thiol-activated cytolysin n=1 Tax=Tenacibaculum polynesiense TaxID=3137857 RepID=A0ABP1F3D1_9FLAO
MNALRTTYFLFLLTLIFSCNIAKPQLTNAHAGKFKVGEKLNKHFLDVQVAVIPVTSPKSIPEKAKTFFDLRDSIPHKFLEILGDKVQKPDSLIKYIKQPLSLVSKSKSNKPKTDYATQKVRFVIGNIKNYQLLATAETPEFLHPNTRLQTLNTTLDFSSSDFEIVSIDKLESEFEEIDLGSLSRTQETNFTSKLTGQVGITNVNQNTIASNNKTSRINENGNVQNVYDQNGNLIGTITGGINDTLTSSNGNENIKTGTGNFGANGELGFNNTESIAEALQVKLKRLKTGFVFNKSSITISQHGSNLLDISDNVIITATIFPKSKAGLNTDSVMLFSSLFKDQTPQDASKIGLNRREIKYMKCQSRKVDIKVTSKGLLRAVQNKMRGDSNLEFDDKVIYYPFDLPAKKPNPNAGAISNWENCVQVYSVEYTDDKTKKVYDLMAGYGNHKEVHFVDGEKDAFISWLRLQLRNPVATKLSHPTLEVFFQERAAAPGGRRPINKVKIIGTTFTNAELAKIKNLKFKFKILN